MRLQKRQIMNKKLFMFLLPTVAICSSCVGKINVLSKYHLRSGSLNLESDALRDYDKVAIFSEKMYNNVLNIIDSFVLLSKHEK